MLRLLCVTAHPDDEAGGFGGTLLKYAERGVDTYVTCLTPGTAATHRGSATTDEELAAIRRKEFASSCERLRVKHGEVLDFRDGALDKENFHEVVGMVVRRIREIKPHVVITFGSEGAVTAHPDHSMASLVATAAFQWAARDNRFTDQFCEGLKPWRSQKLYCATAGFTLAERQPVALAPATAFIDIREFFSGKIEAFHRHTTQAPLFELFESNVSRHGGEERFHLAARTEPGTIERETDLFAGVIE